MLTLDTILKDSMWVAKVGGCRFVGTYAEIEHWYDDEDWKDTDLCAEQPEHLKPFYDAYFKYDRENGFITVQDFYNKVYAQSKRVWTEAEIRELLATNDKFVCRALKKLYERQTEGEKLSKETHVTNGEGFNKVDADVLTNICEWGLSHGKLTAKQLALVRKRIMKYAKQLTRIANAA